MWSKIPSLFRNKYFLALIIVLVWLIFFDTHSIIQQWRMNRQLRELRQEREFYLEEIKRDSTALHKLTSDPEELERFAREQYLMKKQGEDVFVIIEDE